MPRLLLLLALVIGSVFARPLAVVNAQTPAAPADVLVVLEPDGAQLHARISWTQRSVANEVIVMRQAASGHAQLVDLLQQQAPGAKTLRDGASATPDDVYYLHEFVRDADGIIIDFGRYGPFPVSAPPATLDTPALPYTVYLPLVAVR